MVSRAVKTDTFHSVVLGLSSRHMTHNEAVNIDIAVWG